MTRSILRTNIMTDYDFCLAWNWEHDTDFVTMLANAVRHRGITMLQVTPANIAHILQATQENTIAFRAFFDRASDYDLRFVPLGQWVRSHGAYCINPYDQAAHSGDKAAMHLALIGNGIHTPYTIIIPPYKEHPELPTMDLSPLGKSFTIKPAHGGGGEGVITNVTSLSEITKARQKYPADKYLLQAHIVPKQIGSRRAWYRIIYCAGKIYLSWWDTRTFIYTPVTIEEVEKYNLAPLYDITVTLARICRLELFSTEIALTADDLYICVDYVNDQIDLRLQSKTRDGVPDNVVRDIAGRLTALVADRCRL